MRNLQNPTQPEKITAITSKKEPRMTTMMTEFDRVLGGGVVPGLLVVLGGNLGIGKSTLLLQISSQIAAKKRSVLYVSGEESKQQTKLRADRLGVLTEDLYVLAETNLFDIATHIESLKLSLVIIDSILTIIKEEVDSELGSVT